ncbi:DUF7409 domain-containing protein [Halolamina litorea]|uniref:Helix-hairpin-helix domain-containing protein n=2 Tax=Halolamina litorea TaxID=1515593 RepID=A0ABD6BPN7_9EURY
MADVDGTERRAVADPTDLKYVGPATATAIEGAEFSGQAVADKEVSYRMLLEAGINPGVAAKIRRHHSLAWSFNNDGDLDRRSTQVRGLQDEEAAWVASSGIGETDDPDESAETAEPSPASAEDSSDDRTEDEEAAWIADATDREDLSIERIYDGTADDGAVDEDGEAAWVADATAEADDAPSATADGSGDPLAAEAAWRERSKPTPLTELSGIGAEAADQLAEAGVTSVRSLATASPELLSDVTGIDEQRLRRWHREASEMAD